MSQIRRQCRPVTKAAIFISLKETEAQRAYHLPASCRLPNLNVLLFPSPPTLGVRKEAPEKDLKLQGHQFVCHMEKQSQQGNWRLLRRPGQKSCPHQAVDFRSSYLPDK